MKILIACESSGVVREAFRAMGHDAWSCDIKPTEQPGQHLQCDVREVLDDGWDFIGSHPECRYLTVSGMHWTTRGLRDPKLTTEAIAFAELLWAATKKCGRGYLENSKGILPTRSNLGPYTQLIQPYEFGEDASKGTCLWLHGLKPLEQTKYIHPRLVCKKCGGTTQFFESIVAKGCSQCGAEQGLLMPRWANQTDSGQNRLGPSEHRSADRARTYPGIAKAMAEQWGK